MVLIGSNIPLDQLKFPAVSIFIIWPPYASWSSYLTYFEFDFCKHGRLSILLICCYLNLQWFLPIEGGYLEPEDLEKTYRFTQRVVVGGVDISSARKPFDMILPGKYVNKNCVLWSCATIVTWSSTNNNNVQYRCWYETPLMILMFLCGTVSWLAFPNWSILFPDTYLVCLCKTYTLLIVYVKEGH